jgi:hypothetical protein
MTDDSFETLSNEFVELQETEEQKFISRILYARTRAAEGEPLKDYLDADDILQAVDMLADLLDPPMEECKNCEGIGYIQVLSGIMSEYGISMAHKHECRACFGTGEVEL